MIEAPSLDSNAMPGVSTLLSRRRTRSTPGVACTTKGARNTTSVARICRIHFLYLPDLLPIVRHRPHSREITFKEYRRNLKIHSAQHPCDARHEGCDSSKSIAGRDRYLRAPSNCGAISETRSTRLEGSALSEAPISSRPALAIDARLSASRMQPMQ